MEWEKHNKKEKLRGNMAKQPYELGLEKESSLIRAVWEILPFKQTMLLFMIETM